MSIIIDNKNHPSFVINTYLIFKKNGTWHTPKYFSKYFRLTEFHEFGWWWDWFRFTHFHSISQIMFDAAHPLVLQTANFPVKTSFSCKLSDGFNHLSQFAVSRTCGYGTTHWCFKGPVWNLESRQIIVSSYKKHKNRVFFWGDTDNPLSKKIKVDLDFPSLTWKLILICVNKNNCKQNGFPKPTYCFC